MKQPQFDQVTRVEIIDQTGRVYTTGSYKTEVSLQDMGLTLKVFINARPYRDVFKHNPMDFGKAVVEFEKGLKGE